MIEPAVAARAFGPKVAAPGTVQPTEYYTGGTSGAAALASRTCHLIHDALEQTYGAVFLDLSHSHRALCLKALFAHGARWPDAASDLIQATLGPHGRGQAPKQKGNVRRFCGYGIVDPSNVVACAADRATFWAAGSIGSEEAVRIDIPIPRCMSGQARPHELVAALAWFTPVAPGRRSYRTVKLTPLVPDEITNLRLTGAQRQPDANVAVRARSGGGMTEPKHLRPAFQDAVVQVTLANIVTAKTIEARVKQSVKFGRIAASIAEVGLVEPLVVSREEDGRFRLLDGHAHLAALISAGAVEARCLVALDDEAFTYNKRVSHLATIQEHYMIIKALERGASEAKIAASLNLDVAAIRKRRGMLDGI